MRRGCWRRVSGTSYAAPFISGVAALCRGAGIVHDGKAFIHAIECSTVHFKHAPSVLQVDKLADYRQPLLARIAQFLCVD